MVEDKITSLLTRLVREGVFGEGALESIENDDGDIGFQFASALSMLKIRILKGGNNVETIRIVVKTDIDDEFMRKTRDFNSMFFNEVTMYRDVLPFLDPGESTLYPRYYYGHLRDSSPAEDSDVLVVQNLKQVGFKSDKEKVFLDFHHLAIAMEAIGKFHSWSYSAKHNNKSKFMELASALRLVEIRDIEEFSLSKTAFSCMKRGIDKVMENKSDTEVLNNFLEKFETLVETQRFLWTPEEPFGTIIHGDFCKNNVFYKYDSTGMARGIAFFDLQVSRYGCPVTDLSFFLYMHTNTDTREKYWFKLLEIYWSSVRDNVADGVSLPTYGEFLEYFAKKAVYGYIHVSYYLPVMLFDDAEGAQRFFALTSEEKADFFLSMGGEEGRKVISEVVSHLLNMGYINKFLESYENN